MLLTYKIKKLEKIWILLILRYKKVSFNFKICTNKL